MGYHKRKIDKGVLGEFSKIQEEIEELQDAAEQENKVLILVELTDLIGAIQAYTETKYNIGLNDLMKFNKLTQEAFREGKRS